MIVVLVSAPETRIKYDFVVWAAKQQQGGKEWDDDGDNMSLLMGGEKNSASTRWAAQKNHKNSREHSENECDALKGKDDMRGEIPENFIIWKFSINFVFCHCSRDFLSCCPLREGMRVERERRQQRDEFSDGGKKKTEEKLYHLLLLLLFLCASFLFSLKTEIINYKIIHEEQIQTTRIFVALLSCRLTSWA